MPPDLPRKSAFYVQLCVIINDDTEGGREVGRAGQILRVSRAFSGPGLWIYCVGDTLICRVPESKSESEFWSLEAESDPHGNFVLIVLWVAGAQT